MAHLTLVRAKTHYQQLCSCEPTIAKPASHTWSVCRLALRPIRHWSRTISAFLSGWIGAARTASAAVRMDGSELAHWT